MRQQFGRPLCEFQGLQWKFADMAIKLEGAQLLLYRAAANADNGLPSAYETAVAKAACNQAGFEVAHEAVQIMGAAGYSKTSLVEYCMRRCRGWMIAGGSIEMLKNRIAEHVFDRRFDQRPPSRPRRRSDSRSPGGRSARPAVTMRHHAASRAGQLASLLAPQSVAIVGQSNDATKTAGRPLKYLRQAGYAGRIYPINPRRDEVLGERAWPSLAALPEVPEHAYIVASTDATMEAIEECGRLGVPVVTALANGFSETGAEGTAREARISEICEATGTRLVGPSSLGVVDLRHKTFLTANAAFDEPDLPVGRIFAASHSGGMIGTFLSRGKARGIHFAGLVSVGNEVDLSIGEICAATLDDPGIDGYVLFLETMRKAEALRAFALEAAARGKPVLAYKLGRSAAARELAVSHTGALAGEDDIAGMFLAECGIARVDTLEGLIEGFPLLARVPAAARGARRPTRRRGHDHRRRRHHGGRSARRRAASRSSRRRRRRLARIKAATGVDVDAGAARRSDARRRAVQGDEGRARRADHRAGVRSGRGRWSARRRGSIPISRSSRSSTAPAPASRSRRFWCPKRRTRWRGSPPPACRTSTRRRPAPTPSPPRCSGTRRGRSRCAPPNAAGAGRMLDELEAYALLDRIGVPHAPSVALDADIKQAPALPFAYPVVVKALSAKIAHKSDVGGVVLNVRDDAALLAAIAKIRAGAPRSIACWCSR